jgi:hypothetical protein
VTADLRVNPPQVAAGDQHLVPRHCQRRHLPQWLPVDPSARWPYRLPAASGAAWCAALRTVAPRNGARASGIARVASQGWQLCGTPQPPRRVRQPAPAPASQLRATRAANSMASEGRARGPWNTGCVGSRSKGDASRGRRGSARMAVAVVMGGGGVAAASRAAGASAPAAQVARRTRPFPTSPPREVRSRVSPRAARSAARGGACDRRAARPRRPITACGIRRRW